MAAPTTSPRCGVNAGGKPCTNPKHCCNAWVSLRRSITSELLRQLSCRSRSWVGTANPNLLARHLQGFCGTDGLYCGASVCVSGPCRKATAAKPKGRRAAKPVAGNPFAAVGAAPKPGNKTAGVTTKQAAVAPTKPPAKPTPAKPAKPAPQPTAATTTAQPVFPAELGDAATQHSWLWGREGELWRPGGRLPDYSHAGYMAAQRPIPTFPAGFSVKDFGAKGDGVAGAGRCAWRGVQGACCALAAWIASCTEPPQVHAAQTCSRPALTAPFIAQTTPRPSRPPSRPPPPPPSACSPTSAAPPAARCGRNQAVLHSHTAAVTAALAMGVAGCSSEERQAGRTHAANTVFAPVLRSPGLATRGARAWRCSCPRAATRSARSSSCPSPTSSSAARG